MNMVNVGYRSTNYYALDIASGKLLVDCGWPGTFPQFSAELRRKDIAPTEIKYLLATHFHPDHAGLVEDFKRLGARLILLENQVGALEAQPQQGTSMPTLVGVSSTNVLLLTSEDSRHFLASIGLDGEIIPTPGHSADSVTLILDDGSAFTGDLPPRSLVSAENQLAKASWNRIYQHRITRIYPAHGAAPSEI